MVLCAIPVPHLLFFRRGHCPCLCRGGFSDFPTTPDFARSYLYGKDNEFWDDMRANGVTRERFFLYSLLGAAVALGGNLFGVTSGLLSTVAPEASRDLRVDLLFPIGGFKRCAFCVGEGDGQRKVGGNLLL